MLHVLQRLFAFPRRPKKSVSPRWVGPHVEEVEPRLVPDAYTWVGPVGGGTGLWTTLANWQQNGAAATTVPGSVIGRSDDVTIDGNAANGPCEVPQTGGVKECATLKLTNTPSLIIDTSAQLSVTGGAAHSSMDSGTATVNGVFNVAGGNFDWSGGHFIGAGTLLVGTSTTGAGATLLVTQNAQDPDLNLGVGSDFAGSQPGIVLVQNLNQDLGVGPDHAISIYSNGTFTLAQTSGNIVCPGGSTGVSTDVR